MMICCACRVEMRCDKNGVGADFGHGHMFATDRYRCPDCGVLILRTAIGAPAHHDPDREIHDEYLTMEQRGVDRPPELFPKKEMQQAPVELVAGWTADDIIHIAKESFGQQMSRADALDVLSDLGNQMDSIMSAGEEMIEEHMRENLEWTHIDEQDEEEEDADREPADAGVIPIDRDGDGFAPRDEP